MRRKTENAGKVFAPTKKGSNPTVFYLRFGMESKKVEHYFDKSSKKDEEEEVAPFATINIKEPHIKIKKKI